MSTITLGYMADPNTYTENVQKPTKTAEKHKAIRVSESLQELAIALVIALIGLLAIVVQSGWEEPIDITATLFMLIMSIGLTVDTVAGKIMRRKR